MSEPWWKRAVVYQIYPRSFCDASGDGVGDLEGIRRRLDHLEWLGVDAIWLSPFFRSPMKDYGYDVEDYCDVDPLFGDLADFDRLLAEAHARDLRVLIDWVPNHTSDRHPWFVDARRSRQSPRRDWYVWRDGTPDAPPNNWRAAFAPEPAWTWDEATEQWYLHLFLPEQPDLNWRNPEVVTAMHDTLRFWLDRGVDGFRMDVIHCIGKDAALPDYPPERAALPACVLNDDPSTHELLRGIRRVLDEYPGERVMVGEVVLLQTDRLAPYAGEEDALHLVFNFLPLYAAWDAAAWRGRIDEAVEHFHGSGAWPTWVLSNHDNPRHRTRYGGSEARARAAALLLLSLRGTPFLYAGEEFGLTDAVIAPAQRLDPGGRDGCRAPIPWDDAAERGWASSETWLPWPPKAERRNAAAQRRDEGSIAHLYRCMLAARRASPALRSGDFAWLDAPESVLAFERRGGGDRRAMIVAFAGGPHTVDLPGAWCIELASDRRREGERFDGAVAGESALLLRPEGAS
jgi:alpha-glucosidase